MNASRYQKTVQDASLEIPCETVFSRYNLGRGAL
jgi:hypothetical protein